MAGWAPGRGHAAETQAGLSPCRTARADNPGIVLTFVLPTELPHLGKIEELLGGGRIQGRASPTPPETRGGADNWDSSVTSSHPPIRPPAPPRCLLHPYPALAADTASSADERAQVQTPRRLCTAVCCLPRGARVGEGEGLWETGKGWWRLSGACLGALHRCLWEVTL